MARQGIKRAVFVAGAVALASSTHAEAFEPPTEGIVSVRAAGGAPDTARLGFVAGGNGQVVAYVGSAMNGEDVAGAGFVVRVSDGTELAGTGVAYDRATGLAMMRVPGPLPASYEFAREPVEILHAVYGATMNDTTGEIEIVRGTVSGIDPAPETGPGRPRRISHDAAVGDRGIGSPLFDTCGHVAGVIVRDDSVAARVGGLAAPAAWLEHVFADQGLVLARTDNECVTGTELLDIPGQARDKEEGQAQAEAQQKQTSTQAADREEAAEEAREASRESEQALEDKARVAAAKWRIWWAVAVGGSLSLLLALLWVARRRTQGRTRRAGLAVEMMASGAQDAEPASQAREREQEATQAPDVFLTGLDQQGGMVSLRIPGRSIAGPSGSVVGRNPFEGAVVLNQEGVSRRHFRLFVSDGQLMAEDLDSVNGTEIDGSVLTAGSRGVVRNGSQLGVGRLKLTVRLQSRAGEPREGEQ